MLVGNIFFYKKVLVAMLKFSNVVFDTIMIIQGVRWKHFQFGQREMGETKVESFKYSPHFFGVLYSCEFP